MKFMTRIAVAALAAIGFSAAAVAAANNSTVSSEAKAPAPTLGTTATQEVMATNAKKSAGDDMKAKGVDPLFGKSDVSPISLKTAAGGITKVAKAPLLAAGSPCGTGDVATVDGSLLMDAKVDVTTLFKAEASNVALVDTKKAVAEAKDYAWFSEPTKNASSDKVAGTGTQYDEGLAHRASDAGRSERQTSVITV